MPTNQELLFIYDCLKQVFFKDIKPDEFIKISDLLMIFDDVIITWIDIIS